MFLIMENHFNIWWLLKNIYIFIKSRLREVDSNWYPNSGALKHVIGFANNLSIIFFKLGLTIIIYVRGHNNSIVK